MPKTIVILLDGTSNSIKEKRTNILRLYGCLDKTDQQIVYYDPGVGTLGSQHYWSGLAQASSELWGMATGMGIDHNVKEAYRFLVRNCAKGGEDDRICLLGFSRGAYTARMLAGFIHTIGLLEPRNLNLLDHAYRAYKSIGDRSCDCTQPCTCDQGLEEVKLYQRILDTHHPCIHLLGLFDTVASVIEPSRNVLPQLRHHAFTSRNPSVAHVRHAVALDERRRLFDPLLWDTSDPAQDVREVWFTGSHGDIGGGLPEKASALAKISLQWMIEETSRLGLRYCPETVSLLVQGEGQDHKYAPPNPFAPVTNSMTARWKVLEYLPLPQRGSGGLRLSLGRNQPRKVPARSRIHASVLARAALTGELQPNIPDDYRVEGDPSDHTSPGLGVRGVA
ncbi:DUF2235 domain-containing protein [Falsirhodobacter deserti]|uniref:DUF2235 domain-containing protein n=1 Tax=Falsirhodobacter deserti TaxID=1365611 RepID=UPI000FE3E9F9|nr:DUF2235 domain-containing protein [Falsirhodobacter deserti]